MLIKWSGDLERSLFDWDFFPIFRKADWGFQRPLTDVHEDDENTYIDVELPGVKVDDIKINVENNMLTISGERKIKKNKKFHRIERLSGSFERSFILSDTSDVESIKASFNNGVLKVKIPKKPSEIPKKISIKVE